MEEVVVSTKKLKELVRSVSAEDLRDLVLHLARTHPRVREECCSFLERAAPPAAEVAARAVLSLWDVLAADLGELDTYGGGDEEKEDRVAGFLDAVVTKLAEGEVARADRRVLLDNVLRYIASVRSMMEDSLYDLAYAACRDEEDRRHLAQCLVNLGQPWPLDHARRIYRELGDRDNYLALRALRMECGDDYYDLATFLWDRGEREQALRVARDGLERREGRLDGLRRFIGERALEAGDRPQYLELEFARATDPLTEASYRAFRKLCDREEWRVYEPRMLASLERADKQQRLAIHLARREYGLALPILSRMEYPCGWYDGGMVLQAATRLESRYPQEVLGFYKSGLGNLNSTATRKEYARNARIVMKIRHLWVDVLAQPDQWLVFARKVKAHNLSRRAFQEEFARVIPGWPEI